MTIKEITGNRDFYFNHWIREKLPCSSTGFMVSDIDFIMYNYKTKKLMILEVKTRNGEIKKWQRLFYQRLHKWIRKGISKDWTYLGVNLITFEGSCFFDGKCYLNKKEIEESELIAFLSME